MLMFLGMLAAGVLLFALIMVLHRLQYRQKVEAVDRTIPLPPLDPQDKQRVLAIADASDDSLAPDHSHITAREPWLDRMLAAAPETTKLWQAQARDHVAHHDYDRALACCASAFPLMGAFRQAAQILRLQIREAQQQGTDPTTALVDLYQIAAWADLLHARLPDHPPLSHSQLKKFDMRTARHFHFDYKVLGCNELALLTTADKKLVTAAWGHPQQHTHARELHETELQSMLDRNAVNREPHEHTH